MKPTERFTGLANDYSRNRPSYPAAAISHILTESSITSNSIIIDIGCGTGISSRLFSEQGLMVVGVEPNHDMIAKALETSGQEEKADSAYATVEKGKPTYIMGSAENTGLPDDKADLVVCAQAFHWFDPEKALLEFRRLLKPCGFTALIWNERDESDEFTSEYGDLVRTAPDTKNVEMTRAGAGKPLLATALFHKGTVTDFFNEQTLDLQGLNGRMFSSSYAPRDALGRAQFEAALGAMFQKHQKGNQVTLKYKTSVYLARCCP